MNESSSPRRLSDSAINMHRIFESLRAVEVTIYGSLILRNQATIKEKWLATLYSREWVEGIKSPKIGEEENVDN